MSAVSTGIINKTNARPPDPKPSPHSFEWPNAKKASTSERRALAASLQELLPQKGWTHIQLATELWGMGAKGNPNSAALARGWVLANGRFPREDEAAYVAELLDVPVARLLEPDGKFDSHPSMVRASRLRKAKTESRAEKAEKAPRATKRKANGHDPDADFRLPEGVDPPFIKLETSKKNPRLMVFELRGELPYDLAQSIISMIKQAMASATRPE